MKKYFLLLLLLLPVGVFAEGGLYPAEYTIQTKVNLQGKELEEGEFTFELRNEQGNVIETATNDKDGNVVFKTRKDDFKIIGRSWSMPIYNATSYRRRGGTGGGFPASDMIIYTINMVDNKGSQYTIDNDTTYVGVQGGPTYSDDNLISVNYLKNVESLNKPGPTKPDAKPFRISDNDLNGEAYAVFDPTTKVLTIFRDEAGKYSEGQIIDGKKYFTHIEPYQDEYGYWSENYPSSDTKDLVEKIVIKDPIKLKGDYPPYIFNYYQDLKEIEGMDKVDVSELTRYDFMFDEDNSLKVLDLSTWDTASATNFYYTFAYMASLEELYIDNFDTSNVTDFHYMFAYTPALKSINFDGFDMSKAQGSYHSDYMFYYSGVESIDMSNVKFNDNFQYSGYGRMDYLIVYSSYLKYINFPAKFGMGYEMFYNNALLNVVKFNNRDAYPIIGTYLDDDGIERTERDFDSDLDLRSSYFYFPGAKKTLYVNDFRTYMRYGYLPIYDDEGNVVGKDYTELDVSLAVRPLGNTDIPVYNVTYTKAEVKGIEDILENPKTGVFLHTFSVLALLGIFGYVFKKVRKDTYFNN